MTTAVFRRVMGLQLSDGAERIMWHNSTVMWMEKSDVAPRLRHSLLISLMNNWRWLYFQEKAGGALETHLCVRKIETESFRKYTLVVINEVASMTADVQLNQSKYRIDWFIASFFLLFINHKPGFRSPF